MPSWVASTRSSSPDGSALGGAGPVMVSAPTEQQAREQAAMLLQVPEDRVEMTRSE